MRYLCLGYHDEQVWSALPDVDRQQLLDDTLACERVLRDGGHVLDTKGLQSARSAATLRFAGGGASITDDHSRKPRSNLVA